MAFGFGEGIWLHRRIRQIRSLFWEKTDFTSYVRNMIWDTILYKYNGSRIHIQISVMFVDIEFSIRFIRNEK